ncbi:MAG: hypothetical protein HOP36_13375 [Methyloglobulus sp.]|nr:hypothetical protein [Methyloglobulus sp.]
MSRSDYLDSLIKDLNPIEVFDYYDGPRFYSCRDKVGQVFLVYWIDETDEYNAWLYLRVSPERYLSLKCGNISIAKALANPEEESAFVVKNYGTDFSVEEISTAQIEADWLPPVSSFLHLNESALPEKTLSAVEVAMRSDRQVIDLAFDKLSNAHEMGCGRLGKLLDSFQDFIYALACGSQLDVRRIPEVIKFKSEVLVTGLYASSFGIRLQSKGGELFPGDETEKAIEIFANLISTLETPEKISEELHHYNILARSRFKYLLHLLVDSEVSLETDWGAPSGSTLKSRASFNEIKRALIKLKETDDATKNIVERPANLVGVDVESAFFALKIEGNEIIKGKLSDLVSSRQFDIPSRIIAKLEESCVIDPLTDQEKWSYILVDFEKQSS